MKGLHGAWSRAVERIPVKLYPSCIGTAGRLMRVFRRSCVCELSLPRRTGGLTALTLLTTGFRARLSMN